MFKRNLLLGLTLLFLLSASLSAAPIFSDWSIKGIINTTGKDLIRYEAADHVTKGEILTVPAGARIPIEIDVSGDIFKMDDTAVFYIRAQKTFFIKATRSKILFSHNQKDWLSLKDFAQGNLAAGLGQSEHGLSGFINLHADFERHR